MEDKRKTLWQRLRVKYRVVVVNEETLGEKMHMHLSLMNLLLVFTVLTLLTLALFSFLIWTTPLKSYLPGYGVDATIRENLVDATARVDSLQDVLDLQNEYMTSFKRVITGEVEVDSVHSMDSLYIVQKEQLLAAKSEVLEDFVTDYESQVDDQLRLFDKAINNEHSTPVFCKPVNGEVSVADENTIRVQTADKEPILAVLNGSVVGVTYDMFTGWTITVQHGENWLSIYSGAESASCRVGDKVKAGDVIATMDGERVFGLQLWENGHAVNPIDVISF